MPFALHLEKTERVFYVKLFLDAGIGRSCDIGVEDAVMPTTPVSEVFKIIVELVASCVSKKIK